MDRSHLGKIENGQTNPSIRTLYYIAKALGVPLFFLFRSN
jgi:transcriptional regulator with XRE-family HTH domain